MLISIAAVLFTFPPAVRKIPPHPRSIFASLFYAPFLMAATLAGLSLGVISICISLVAEDVEHVFLSFWLLYFFFWEVLVQLTSPFTGWTL